MTQIFNEDGSVTPVTRVVAEPCFVTAKKEYKSGVGVQIATREVESKRVNKAQEGFFKKVFKKDLAYRSLKEFKLRTDDAMLEKLNIGQKLDASTFTIGDIVDVRGTSKGKGFQGVVKRHGFHGSPASHGHKDQLRMPGSIGATGPAHVFKGTRMGGHMGDQNATIKNLEIVGVDAEKNEILIKGALPGSRNGLVYVWGKGEFELPKEEEKKPVETEKTAEPVESKQSGDEVSAEPKVEEEKKPAVAKENQTVEPKVAEKKAEAKKEEVKKEQPKPENKKVEEKK